MKEINRNLSVKDCWKMVNRIENAKTPSEIRERCRIAEAWLNENERITNEEYNELMMSVSYIYRDSYH